MSIHNYRDTDDFGTLMQPNEEQTDQIMKRPGTQAAASRTKNSFGQLGGVNTKTTNFAAE